MALNLTFLMFTFTNINYCIDVSIVLYDQYILNIKMSHKKLSRLTKIKRFRTGNIF